MHLLQICNVGQITGGTAACAWSVARALPTFRHTVAFLSRVDAATRRAWQGQNIEEWSQYDPRRAEALTPDLVLLHNVSSLKRPDDIRPIAVPTVQYVHSQGTRYAANRTVYCSQWLSEQSGGGLHDVLWQGVPCPPRPEGVLRSAGPRLRVGRICTPTARKWPAALIPFYTELAGRHPLVDWEFIGCPPAMQADLQIACHGRASFRPASWEARSHLWNWDALLYHHPTLTESFGRTVAEAARTGCVPIVDARGGFVEQLEQLPGRACQALEDFSDALHWLTTCRAEVATLPLQVQADQHFSLRAFRERLLPVFSETALATDRH